MLANFFGKSKPITSLVLLLLFLGYFILAFFNNYAVNFYRENGFSSYFSYSFLIISTFFFYNFIAVKNNLTFDNSYAFLFFVICLGLLPTTFLNEKTLYINLILLLFLRKVYSLQSSKNVFKKLFDGGLWLGIGFLTEPFIIVFAILFYIAIYIHQKITIRTLFIPIIGFVVPVLLYFTYHFWYDSIDNFYQLFDWFSSYNLNQYNSTKYILSGLTIGVFLLFSVLAKSPKTFSISNTFRKSWTLILIHFIVACLLIFFLKKHNGSELIYALFPVSIIIANGLELIKKTLLKDIIIVLFLIVSILIYFL